MILISHRGNTEGKITSRENCPRYIQEALDIGYDVEVDTWAADSKLFLGHDFPQYEIEEDWLAERIDRLWIHCKNLKALEWFGKKSDFNYFWHQKDDFTLTSRGFIWAYPGKQLTTNSVCVMPEVVDFKYKEEELRMCVGICSDYVSNYKTYTAVCHKEG